MHTIKLHLFNWISCLTAILLFSACSDDRISNNSADIFNDDDYVSVVLNATIDNDTEPNVIFSPVKGEGIETWVTTDKFRESNATKASANIRSLMLFQYDGTGQLIHSQRIGDLTSLTNIPIKLKKGRDNKVIFISNAKQIDWNNMSLVLSLEKLKQLNYDYTLINSDEEVPLVGSVDIELITESLRIEELILKRIAAKVIFNVSDVDARYKVKHVSLMNIPAKMYFLNTSDDTIFPEGSKTSHCVHPKTYYAKDNPTQMVWYMPINRRGSNGSAISLRDKTDKTAPTGQASFASYISIYCENNSPEATIKDGICSIYLGSNNPKDYNVKANNKYKINTLFNGNEIPKDDPRVDINSGNFSFEISFADADEYNLKKISKMVAEINGQKFTPNIRLIRTYGRKYRIAGNLKLEYRDNVMTHLSFYDKNDNELSCYMDNKVFYLKGDVYRKLIGPKMNFYFSGLFCGLGNGSASFPYEVCSPNTLSNVRDLALLGEKYNTHVLQVNDVDLKNKPWTPIPAFYLIYDGGNYSISNLNINRYTSDVGLFAVVSKYSSLLKNITIKSGSVTGYSYVGGIAGRILRGTQVVNCKNYAEVHGEENVGGICGEFYDGKLLSDCTNYGDISGAQSIGGITGVFRSNDLEKCGNYGNVSGSSNAVGGIAGVADFNHDIEDCYNRGTITGKSQVGGIEGYSRADEIERSYNCGDIRGYGTYAGGIIGESVAGGPEFHRCYNHATINARGVSGGIVGKANGTVKTYDVYHIGKIMLESNDIAGGICGEAYSVNTVNSCYTACYTYTKSFFEGDFGHVAGHCSYYSLDNTYYINDRDDFNAVASGYVWGNKYPTGVTDQQLRGQTPIVINGSSNYILDWLNSSRLVWEQQNNGFPYLKGF